MFKFKKSYSFDNDIFEKIFILAMFLFFGLFLYYFIKDINGNQANIFFFKTGNFMADFTNGAKYSVDLNPYVNDMYGYKEKAYLPISYVIQYFFSRLADYKNSANAGSSTMGLTTMFISIFFICSVLYIQLFDLKVGSKVKKFLVATSLFISSIFLFAFERGNLVIFAAVLVTFFLACYKHENKVIREMALLALAFAAALKGSPALFGILLIYNKRYLDAIRAAIYGLLFAFVPFLFLQGGFSNIQYFLRNLALNTEYYHYRVMPRLGIAHIFIPYLKDTNDVVKTAAFWEIFSGIMAVLSLFVAPILKKKWKAFGIIACIIMMLPSTSGLYNALYLFPVIIIFFNQKKHPAFDFVYLGLFIAALMPLQLPGISTYIITDISLSLMWVLLLGEGLYKSVFFIKEKLAKIKAKSIIYEKI